MKCLFVVPTIMGKPDQEIVCVENLAKQVPECRVLFISNVEDPDFTNYTPTLSNIEKRVSGTKYSIAKAVNLAIDELQDEEYFCFVQSDVMVNREFLEAFEKIVSDETLNTGVIGTARRNIFDRYNIKMAPKYGVTFHKTLWSDSIMFFKRDLINVIGKFNEDYLGDKESQEYCYRAHKAGYNNYYVQPGQHMIFKHHSVPFTGKVKYDKNEFLSVVETTRNKFRKQWSQWEENQVRSFV